MLVLILPLWPKWPGILMSKLPRDTTGDRKSGNRMQPIFSKFLTGGTIAQNKQANKVPDFYQWYFVCFLQLLIII